MNLTKANLVIRQGKEENYKPVLYIEPVTAGTAFQTTLQHFFSKISAKFTGVELYKAGKEWSAKLLVTLVEGHEKHFARVTEKFLDY